MGSQIVPDTAAYSRERERIAIGPHNYRVREQACAIIVQAWQFQRAFIGMGAFFDLWSGINRYAVVMMCVLDTVSVLVFSTD
jgi:hypothetical protein